VIAIIDVIAPVVVGVHLNGNDTLIVIRPVGRHDTSFCLVTPHPASA
jgi:hypothetical protein